MSIFAIGDEDWPGVSKCIEEIGELQIELAKLTQSLGKLTGSRGAIAHWSGDLKERIENEAADVFAALEFVIKHSLLDEETIAYRRNRKGLLFEKWHTCTENNIVSHLGTVEWRISSDDLELTLLMDGQRVGGISVWTDNKTGEVAWWSAALMVPSAEDMNAGIYHSDEAAQKGLIEAAIKQRASLQIN